MQEIVVRITPEEQIRMQQIVLDKDVEEALRLIRVLLDRVESVTRRQMKPPLNTWKAR